VFTVQDIAHLLRSGRLGGADKVSTVGPGVKPIIEVHGGPVELAGMAYSYHELQERLFELVAERAAGRRPVRLAVVHADAPQRARALLNAAIRRFAPEEALLQSATPGMATHVGPGALGLCYCAGV
jgi:fatty acid-binding protein DegV